MNPSILYFSRAGNAFKALFFMALAVLAFGVAYLLVGDLQPAQPPQQVAPGGLLLPTPAPRADPFAPLKLLLMLAAGSAALYYAARHAARMVTRAVAVKVEGGELHFHPSYAAVPEMLPIQAIEAAVFDRADRLPALDAGAGVLGAAKLGARARHGLYLRYRSDGQMGEVQLIDNDFDGGAEQLRRFAAQLEVWRRSRARDNR